MSVNRAVAITPLYYILVALINFIIIIMFEMYVHKKLIYFVRREAERARENVCERNGQRPEEESWTIVCMCVCRRVHVRVHVHTHM